jgi:arylformamidase
MQVRTARRKSLGNIIDISLPLSPTLPRWPGSASLCIEHWISADSRTVIDSVISVGVQAGTHIDAPIHFLPGREDMTQVPFGALLGPCYVVCATEVSAVTSSDLESLYIPSDTTRLLLRTRNSDRWASGAQDFDPDFVALTRDAARWVVEHSIELIGVDYLSIQRFSDGPDMHLILLEAGVVVLEGLCLGGVVQGSYELLCLSIKLPGAEEAPARAILRKGE